jgi:hypothetical protein
MPVLIGQDASDRFLQRRLAAHQLHAEALARAVVLEDEREADPLGRGRDVLLPHHGDGRWRGDAEGGQRLVLRDLRQFELDRAPPVHHEPPVPFQPFDHRPRIFRREGVPAGVG